MLKELQAVSMERDHLHMKYDELKQKIKCIDDKLDGVDGFSDKAAP